MPLTAVAVMDADDHQKEYWAGQIEVYGRSRHLPRSRCKSSAKFATSASMAALHSLYSAGGDIDGGCVRGHAAAPGQRCNGLDRLSIYHRSLCGPSTNVNCAVSLKQRVLNLLEAYQIGNTLLGTTKCELQGFSGSGLFNPIPEWA